MMSPAYVLYKIWKYQARLVQLTFWVLKGSLELDRGIKGAVPFNLIFQDRLGFMGLLDIFQKVSQFTSVTCSPDQEAMDPPQGGW